MSTKAPRLLRNLRILLDSSLQHAREDPALLAIQVSRRLPMAARRRAGNFLSAVASRVPRAEGAASLGAVMAGRTAQAESILLGASRLSRLGGEVAILVDLPSLVTQQAAVATRARAAWTRGDLQGAVALLDDAGAGTTHLAERLRSELRLLEPGARLGAVDQRMLRQSAPRRRTPGALPGPGRLRVLHLLTNSLPHTQSGYSLRSHRILVALRDHGVESVALTRTGYPVMIGKVFAVEEDVIDGIRYCRTLPRSLGATPEARLDQEVAEAMAVVDSFRPDVLHATTDFRNALVAQEVSARTGIPWVFEVRGLQEQTWIASHRTERERENAAASEKARVVAEREGELARAADGVVTLSRTMAEELVARNVPDDHITLVPNGIDALLLTEEVTVDVARSRIGLQLPEDAIVIGAASALVDYEGFDVLLRAAAQIIKESDALGEHLHVVLVGDGVAAPSLVALAAELGIAERVLLPGRIPREVARDWVRALDLVVIPRLDRAVSRAVTPQKPIEAMALGRPVVVSNLPALRETVTDGDGRLCALVAVSEDDADLATRITELLEDRNLADELVRRGRDLAASRSWPEMMRRYDAVYRRAIGGAAKGVPDVE